jgi:hypothetical protein
LPETFEFVDEFRCLLELGELGQMSPDVAPVESVGLPDEDAFDVHPILGSVRERFEYD